MGAEEKFPEFDSAFFIQHFLLFLFSNKSNRYVSTVKQIIYYYDDFLAVCDWVVGLRVRTTWGLKTCYSTFEVNVAVNVNFKANFDINKAVARRKQINEVLPRKKSEVDVKPTLF